MVFQLEESNSNNSEDILLPQHKIPDLFESLTSPHQQLA